MDQSWSGRFSHLFTNKLIGEAKHTVGDCVAARDFVARYYLYPDYIHGPWPMDLRVELIVYRPHFSIGSSRAVGSFMDDVRT